MAQKRSKRRRKESASRKKFLRLARLWQPDEWMVLSAVAILVGLLSGAGVWLFKRLIALVQLAAGDGIGAALSPLGGWTLVLLPVIGGLAVGLIAHFLVGEERHHGVAGIMEAAALAGGRLRYKRAPAKAVAAAVGIGSGASVGPEDPSVQIGANLGSLFGQKLRMSDERVRSLVAAGAAGGIAAAFNSPIAGVFFALEVILGEIAGSALGIVVVASVVSAVFTQAVEGVQPAFLVPAYAFHSPLELPLYLGLGMLSGPTAALYIRALYFMRDLFKAWRAPGWLKPAVAGLAVGITGLFLPQLLGVGYGTIEEILTGALPVLPLLLALLAGKLVLTAVSIGGGFLGGVFAPALFLGATLGGAYGLLAAQAFPGLQIDPPAFAMVGMAAVLAGAAHSPLTAILLLFEMTNDYRIILPLMLAVVVSQVVARLLQRDSVYTMDLARKGIHLRRGRDVEVLEGIMVGEVMQTGVRTLNESDTLEEAAEVFARTRRHGLPVLDDDRAMIGMLTVQDLDKAFAEDQGDRTAGEVCSQDLVVAYPDETIGAALRRMSPLDLGRLPVIDRNNPRRLLGLLRRSDIVRAYDLALSRRTADRHRAQQSRLGAMHGDEITVTEIVVEPGATCAGLQMKEVDWPPHCVIASLRRGSQLLIPRGDTIIEEGDVLVAVADGQAQEEVQRICMGGVVK